VRNSVEKHCFQHVSARHAIPRAGVGENTTFSSVFYAGVGEKTQFLNPNSTRNFPINPVVLIHKYSFKFWRFKRKESTRSIKGGVSH